MKPYLIVANRSSSPDSDMTNKEHTRLSMQLQDPVGTFINPLAQELAICSDMQKTGI
jgi:hypothetical protein